MFKPTRQAIRHALLREMAMRAMTARDRSKRNKSDRRTVLEKGQPEGSQAGSSGKNLATPSLEEGGGHRRCPAVSPSIPLSIEEVGGDPAGSGFKLKATRAEGEPLWAYRYRVGGRCLARLQGRRVQEQG